MFCGIDLGGTKIEGAVLESLESSQTLERIRVETESHLGYRQILSKIGSLVDSLEQAVGRKFDCIGLGHPGATEPSTGFIKNANTQCLNGEPLAADLESSLGRKVVAANDANCFALAEARFGAAEGCDIVFGVILGTGVGGGIVIRGEIVNGLQGIAGEWGHNTFSYPGSDHSEIVGAEQQCYCGKTACVETVISGPALEKYYHELSGQYASLREIAEKKDRYSRLTLERLSFCFGHAISQVINVLDPDCVVLGGGVSNLSCLYSDGVRYARESVFNHEMATPIRKNLLGDSAGVIGAAILPALHAVPATGSSRGSSYHLISCVTEEVGVWFLVDGMIKNASRIGFGWLWGRSLRMPETDGKEKLEPLQNQGFGGWRLWWGFCGAVTWDCS